MTGANPAGEASALLTEQFGWPPRAGVLLAGSHAEGVQMPGSNVNVIVLEAPPGWQPRAGDRPGLLRPMSIAQNYLFELESTAVSIDVVAGTRLTELAELAAGMALLADPRTPELALPILDALEIRLLSRLRTGTVLSGAEQVGYWRDRLTLSWLPAHHCVSSYLAGRHFLAKAAVAQDKGWGLDAAVLLRMAVDELMLSALAARGRVLHELKNLGRQVRQVVDTEGDLPDVLLAADSLLGGALLSDPDRLTRVERLFEQLRSLLPVTEAGQRAARYLDSRP